LDYRIENDWLETDDAWAECRRCDSEAEGARQQMTLYAGVLSTIPAGLRGPLITCFNDIAKNFAEHRWEPAELNGGKFCEIVYTIVEGAVSGKFATKPAKPSRMVDACRALEGAPANAARPGDRSLRVLIPRILPVLYEIRNSRGVGHTGGEVDPNFQDAVAVYQMASWIMAELVRIFHQVSTDEAQKTVDGLVQRKHPLIWQQDGIRRVMDPNLSKSDQSLLLLYSSGGWMNEKELVASVEYQNLTQYRNRVLTPLHQQRMIEYDTTLRRAHLTPLGSSDVENRLLRNYI
jgi:hypothetical protein